MINHTVSNHPTGVPDSRSVDSELHLPGVWDVAAVAELIRSKCTLGESPTFLFLGRSEAALLRQHLEEAFGQGTAPRLKGTYYLGLEVIEIDVDTFVRVGGRKRTVAVPDTLARRPPGRDHETDSLWRLRLD